MTGCRILHRAICAILLLSLLGCAPKQETDERAWLTDRAAARARMEGLLRDAGLTADFIECGPWILAVRADAATRERIRRFTATLHAGTDELFLPARGPVQVFVFDTREALAPHLDAFIGDGGAHEPTMGDYFPDNRVVVISMQWGLGWLGDLMLQARLTDDWAGAPRQPNRWFRSAFESMLYNCYRRPTGEFLGYNVMSYYRPQAQALIAEGRMIPLRNYLEDDHDFDALVGNQSRVQGREFLAWLHARGLLFEFYKTYRRDCAKDPAGIATVQALTGMKLHEIEADWLRWLRTADGEIGDSEMAAPFPVLGVLVERKKATDSDAGLALVTVDPLSPAWRCGLRPGDTLLALDGRPVNTLDALLAVLRARTLDTTIAVTFNRNGRDQETVVLLDRLIDG